MQNGSWLIDDLAHRRLFARQTLLARLKTLSPISWWALGMMTLIFAVIFTA